MLKRIREMFKNEKGLTLVELLAVIVILAIVGAIAFVMIGNIIENSKKDAHIANAMQLVDSAKLYQSSGEKIETGTTGVSYGTLNGAGMIDTLTDPWTKKEYEDNGIKVTVEKDPDNGNKEEYKVYLKDDAGKNKMNGVKESVLKQGRDEVFK